MTPIFLYKPLFLWGVGPLYLFSLIFCLSLFLSLKTLNHSIPVDSSVLSQWILRPWYYAPFSFPSTKPLSLLPFQRPSFLIYLSSLFPKQNFELCCLWNTTIMHLILDDHLSFNIFHLHLEHVHIFFSTYTLLLRILPSTISCINEVLSILLPSTIPCINEVLSILCCQSLPPLTNSLLSIRHISITVILPLIFFLGSSSFAVLLSSLACPTHIKLHKWMLCVCYHLSFSSLRFFNSLEPISYLSEHVTKSALCKSHYII